MNPTWQPLLELLTGKLGWLPALLTWIGALRLPMKLVQSWVQNFLTAFVARVAASPQTDDDAQLRKLLDSLGYRMLAFTLDAALSLKLPTSDSLDTHQATKAAQPSPSGAGPWLILGFCALLLFPGCVNLDPAGTYKGDALLYHSELATTTSYDVLKTFLDWEKANAPALVKWPQIHQAAENIRAHWEQWFTTAYAMHDAYKADPSQVNADNLQTALRILREALNQATGYMATATKGN